jgi:hypothetical protein
MVTVRTYWSPAQAALAKSLLDNYEIPCALLDENASVYSRGGQFAIPIRLAVDEGEADRAICLLKGDFEKASEPDTGDTVNGLPIEDSVATENANRNPWELLVVAFYFSLPAICLILTRFPIDVAGRWGALLHRTRNHHPVSGLGGIRLRSPPSRNIFYYSSFGEG